MPTARRLAASGGHHTAIAICDGVLMCALAGVVWANDETDDIVRISAAIAIIDGGLTLATVIFHFMSRTVLRADHAAAATEGAAICSCPGCGTSLWFPAGEISLPAL